MTERVVVYIGNANVYSMMKISAKSLLYHSKVDKIYFLIDDAEFPDELPDIIHCINVHDQDFFPPSCPNMDHFYSYMTLMRSVLSKVIDDNRVLLLDPDTIVTTSIDEIWDYDISEYYFAAVPETRVSNHDRSPYFNAGVMLMNLDKFRKDGMDVRLLYELNHTRYANLEQDALNILCDEHILTLPSDYNASFVTDETDHPLIRHCLSLDKHLFTHYAKPYLKQKQTWNEIINMNNERQAKLHE